VVNPYFTVAEKAMRRMHAFLSEFGMTPSSRSRITAGLGAGGDRRQDDPAEAFFG
jgi:P27 family predicted phage terminase small subunit